MYLKIQVGKSSMSQMGKDIGELLKLFPIQKQDGRTR